MRARPVIAVAAALAAVACVVVFWRHGAQGDAGLQHWLAVHTGTLNEPGGYYGFWSGFGSDLGEVTLLAAVLGVYHRHNCHTKGCWRIGRHVVAGTPWCNRHHEAARADVPDAVPAAADPLDARFTKLIESVDGLAEAIRAAMAPSGPRSGGFAK